VSLGGDTTPPADRRSVWLGKLDPAGNRLWQVFGVSGRVAADGEGNVLHASLGAVVKRDPAGVPIWRHAQPVVGGGLVGAVAADSAGRVIYAGTFTGSVDFGDGPVESARPALFVAALAP
jgi:hypothetical protein